MANDIQFTNILNMSSLGDKLRDVRQEKNLTLSQAQKQTRIDITILKAIEDGRCDSVLSPTYVKSFLRKYSDFLGLDSLQILNEYMRLHPEMGSRTVNKLPAPEASSKDRSNIVSVIRLAAIGVIVIILAAFVGGKVVVHFKRPGMIKSVYASKAKRPAVQPSPSKKAPRKSTGPKNAAEISIPKNVSLKLLLKVNQTVLIKMKTDGNLLFERVLPKGTAEMFTAENAINIYVAKGEAIELVLNGKPLGPLEKGLLRNVEITRTGIKVK